MNIAKLGEPEYWTWIPVASGAFPEDCRPVIAWNSNDDRPCTALYDQEEGCWFAQFDASPFDDGVITHYCHYLTPAGGNSGA